VILSAMNTVDYDTQALCGDCLPEWALALALNTNPGLIDEDGRHKWVLAVPEAMHDGASELYHAEVYPDSEASMPPGGPTRAESSDGGSADEAGSSDDACPVCGAPPDGVHDESLHAQGPAPAGDDRDGAQ
jgi:hypothetical protein